MIATAIEPIGVLDLEVALVDARSDAIAYRETLLAALDQLQELTQRVGRLVEVNGRLHDELRQLRAAQQDTA